MGNDLFELGGRLALITGSSDGLGYVLARGLGRAGAALVLNGRDQTKLNAAVARLQDDGLQVAGYPFDVTDADAVAAAVSRIESQAGPIEILVNNAGVTRRADLAELPETAWQEVLATNLTGPFLVSREVGTRMVARQSGKIINLCSLMSELGRPTTGAYAASKGGLKMLTKALAVDWARHNIQVNAIGPGYFLTDMTRSLAADAEFDAWLKHRTPAARWGDPEELVGAVVFLASPASSFVNGQILYVDGGVLASL